MALQNIYLLQYNNYFNRIVKKEPTVTDYTSKAVYTLTRTSFNPNDGVNTSHVMNTEVDCDYAVVTDLTGTEIASRWFVLESKRERNGQVTLTLRRDLVVDYYEDIIDSPCYIEKATLQPNDPFIFNKEGGGYNEIKTKETLLKDAGRCKWLVAFISKKRAGNVEARTFKAKLNANPEYTVAGINNWEYYKYVDKSNYSSVDAVYINSALSRVSASGPPHGRYTYVTKINEVSCFSVSREYSKAPTYTQLRYGLTYQPSTTEVELAFDQNNQFQQALNNINFDSTINQNTIQGLDGKYIKDTTDNKIYKIKIEFKIGQFFDESIPKNSAFFNSLKSLWTSFTDVTYFDNGDDPFTAQYLGTRFEMTLTEVDRVSVEYILPETMNEYGLTDQPFDIICTPYEVETLDGSAPGFSKGASAYTFALDAALPLFSAIAQDALCYDLQLLPYTITGDAVTLRNTVNYQIKFESTAKVDLVDVGGKKLPIWWPSISSFRNIIQLTNDDRVYITEPKIQNECDKYRFVAPNYGSAFDFNAAMNGGLFSVEINCTYLPYQSYIHVNPTFGGLYGKDFDDQRGLVCGGNYSLSATTDAWRNYVTQNKNYNEIFDREIQNMEVNRKYQRQQEIANVITGTLGGASSGAIAGGLVSASPISAIAGGILGAGASLAGGLTDLNISQKLYDESKSFKQDMRNFNLGNIQALPQSLSRTSAYNVDNKYFPFIEYYTCTDEEKQALRDQIKYTGMTVMRTGKIRDYLQSDYSYVQGKMIRMESIKNDNHLLVAIAEEIMKGVYIK